VPATRQDKRSLSLVRHSTTDAVLHSKLINCDAIRVMQHRIRVNGSSDTLITQPDELVPFPTTPVPAAARSPALLELDAGRAPARSRRGRGTAAHAPQPQATARSERMRRIRPQPGRVLGCDAAASARLPPAPAGSISIRAAPHGTPVPVRAPTKLGGIRHHPLPGESPLWPGGR